MNSEKILQMSAISKNFPGIRALTNVDFDLNFGEVHALMGENGAGKSTLVRILSGVVSKDSGTIIYKNKEIHPDSPYSAQKLGIAIMHQERSLIAYLNAAQNILLGREPVYGRLAMIDSSSLYEKAKEVLTEIAPDIPLNIPVKKLSAAQQQLVEIAKAISFQADIIIMDEPTSSLTEKETNTLFSIIKKLVAQGKSIIYISHRIKEVFQISDRITVLRDGHKVVTFDTKSATEEKLLQMMVGRNLENMYIRTHPLKGPMVLSVKNLTRKKVFHNISFNLHSGEVLGIAGLVGAGRTEIVRAIFGADPLSSGEILIDNKKVIIKSPNDAIKYGIGLVPEDRREQGLILEMSIKENITLAMLDQITNFGYINRQKQLNLCNEFVSKLYIRTSGVNGKVKNLSGGNQQKIVMTKWLAKKPKILILDEPTRGIDVGAKSEIYTVINQLANQGMAILIISSEMPELLGLSDRILVLNNGGMVGELSQNEATEEKIMTYCVGRAFDEQKRT